MVTVSPIRIGFSNKIIKPDTKLAKISCKPNPKPTVNAATSHWVFAQSTPKKLKPTTKLIEIVMYFANVVIAKPVPGERSRCCKIKSSRAPDKLRTNTSVSTKIIMANKQLFKVIGSIYSTPFKVLEASHKVMVSKKIKAR